MFCRFSSKVPLLRSLVHRSDLASRDENQRDWLCHFFDPLFIVPTAWHRLQAAKERLCHFFDPLFIVPTPAPAPLLGSRPRCATSSIPCSSFRRMGCRVMYYWLIVCHFFDPLFIVPTTVAVSGFAAPYPSATSSIPCSSFRQRRTEEERRKLEVPLLRSLVHRSDKRVLLHTNSHDSATSSIPCSSFRRGRVSSRRTWPGSATSSIPCSSFRRHRPSEH